MSWCAAEGAAKRPQMVRLLLQVSDSVAMNEG
jgi:hypothetical protein